MAEHGFEVVADSGSALFVEIPEGKVAIWGNRIELDREAVEALEIGSFHDGVARGDYERRTGVDTYVYDDGVRQTWEMQAVRIWLNVELGSRPAAETLTRLIAATKQTPYMTCPQWEAPFARMAPTSGAPGSEITVVGRGVGSDKGGNPAFTTAVQVWWNLDPVRSQFAGSKMQSPAPVQDGPVELIAEQFVNHQCEYESTFAIPDVDPGDYEVVLIYFGGDLDGQNWGRSDFPLGTVTVSG